jgi:Ran GTPase-activating protein (RanGAP) involved in mRNA processing and transport
MAAMKFNENLQELHIANNNLLPEDAMNIGGILRTNHTLRVLDMRDNYIQVWTIQSYQYIYIYLTCTLQCL